MKACLYCQKEYQNKREASKFCSDRCRVAYNRKHPKQKPVSQMQLQVLYDAMLEMVSKGGQTQQLTIAAPQTAYTAKIVQQLPQVAVQAIMHKYVEERREISDEEQYLDWVGRLNNDTRLTTKQKELVKTTR